MTAPVFVVDEVPSGGGEFVLDGPEGRHAVSVRRLRAGERVVLTDGLGRGASATVLAAEGKDRLTVELTGSLVDPEPAPRITVVQALPKGDRGELAVETMTETGVDAIVPWSASRCITQWRGERGVKSLGKWRATAREAGKQARRLRFPEVSGLASTKDVAALLAGAAFAGVLHEEGSSPLASAELPATGDAILVVGPEGGVSPEELDLFAASGAQPYRLGPSVLRTSTAGTAAAALLLGRSGRWG
ncbi:16S rRNA (uracil(1498)-N(3))-methyltransferase [Streptomyces sp. B-S-A8]|uniref:Ribosomal RNA small subunit methyltransferase E n=1 Tax=Streptomyces solicavernae TaxID=3043614 RepID=A0ABT6RW61_9ACTN|nr:16S rRNA (uracil(1498)-N(3))-methyltransferase [Streptomyces sp. B-S-A8]MDI3388627.1 16S rRNA (uracil(1498)-N(3))-methyltransferase [Streptomyces sp. B-S-A8]